MVDHAARDYADELLRLTGGKGVDIVLAMLANVNLQKNLDIENHPTPDGRDWTLRQPGLCPGSTFARSVRRSIASRRAVSW